jgi:hypothetical protein
MALSSSFALYIKRCVESDYYLLQLPEMKEVYTAELEKVIAEHVSCQAEALVTAEHLAMLKADGVIGSVWERALVENARAAAAERIAFIILESVRIENKVCDAFYTWVQWRYQLLRSVKEV